MTIITDDGKPCEGLEQGPFEPIAVIGVAAMMPDAKDLEAFWQNIIDSHVSIKEIKEGRWPGPVNHFWTEGKPGDIAHGYTYAKIGAFVEDYEFDWRRWRQPPGTIPQIDPCQLWAVSVSAKAIEQAGYGEGEKEFPRERAGVVFANALGGENRNMSNIRVWSNHTSELAQQHGLPASSKEAFMDAMNEHSPKVDEDTMPGELANVVSGRVANLLDLQGPNHAMDAACASSMAAVMDACRLLQTRQADVMLAGATDRTMDPATYAKFSAIGALSPTHSTPFDARANGFVMGEGAGVMVLKRLSDAIADDDTIHAVIRGIGGSSDGRGKGITAPSQRGQIQAIARAYNQAGYSASSVELVEAHGTSTKVGDATELSTLTRLWTDVASGDNVAVGSIKSQIGHLKAAAGIAGIIKSVMALHHRTIPPSAGFETPNPTVDWANIPFFVPTSPLEWPEPESHPRRAGVSAFGFGGTNFHIALEGYNPDYHRSIAEDWQQRWKAYAKSTTVSAPSILDASATATMTHEQLKAIEGGVLLLSGSSIEALATSLESTSFNGPTFDDDPRGLRLSMALQSASASYDSSDACRLALVATSWAEFEKRKALAISSLADSGKWGFLQAQGVLVSDQPAMPEGAKVAHMYPGQGSQYVGMTYDLHQRYTPVQDVWNASDSTMVEVLDGETLSSFVLRSDLSDEERKAAEHKLKQTEYTQPAMLTADLAIEHALNAYGHEPDMVAGHSLGEYAALMASGILNMDGALRAAAARGTEMGSVEIDDKGLMASVTAPYDAVERILDAAEGYVIAANKNSPKMTVIAGATQAVQEVMKAFEAEGFNCVPLATSHAFHSSIVAPANEPLRRFLSSLEINWPKIPITANVDGTFYPDDGPDAKEGILSKLAPQMASSVEWTSQINTMYEAGARIFVEVGPKRALTMFATQILEDHPHLAVMTNHPKQGGIASFLTAIGALALAGRPPKAIEGTSPVFSEAFRAGPIEAHQAPGLPQRSNQEELRVRARPLPTKGGSSVGAPTAVQTVATPVQKEPTVTDYVGDRIAQHCGYPAMFCQGMVNLRLGLGLTDQSIQSIVSAIAAEAQTDAEIDIQSATTAADIERWVSQPPAGWSPRVHLAKTNSSPAVIQTQATHDPMMQRRVDPYVVSGISLGLPGGEKVFDEDVFERLVRGETCLQEVTDEYKQRLLDKNIKRLIKGRDGSVNIEQATSFDDIPQLAGVKGAFDLSEEFGIDPKMVMAWDITTQLAMASGLLALRDAGIPLTPEEQVGKGGLRLIRNWQVPSTHRDRTGIVFASCFPGVQMAMKHAKSDGDDGEGKFDRRYLFQVLTMGHSQFAQFTGIRGPTTTINLACASATGAFQIAEDWLAADRVDRVVILSSDDVTGDDMWEWIGSGFASTGAASTSNVIEEAALPFDKRRNGLVLGMGAASFVVERKSSADERGVQPIAELLGATTANSAYHGTRLDVEHVATTVDNFVGEMEKKWGLDRHAIAKNTVFYSHETYTPARGGSAQSEVRALRQTFGESTDSLVIANTKGFTGHPMGVGIEDASMFYGLLTKRIPPIANHKVVDEELGNLHLSKGGDYPNIQYGLRFAAGFGSQIGLSFVRAWPIQGERIDGKRLLAWCRGLAGTDDIQLRLLDNKLVAYVDGDNNLHGGIQGEVYDITAPFEGLPTEVSPVEQPLVQAATPEPEPVKAEPTPAPVATTAAASGDMVQTVIDVVVKHTGYPADFVELDQDLEGELGIDTVKQAEIMVDVREIFSLPVDEDFLLSDHPTLNHFVAYIVKMKGGSTTPEPETASMPAVETSSPVEPTSMEHDGCRRWQIEVEEAESIASTLALDGTVVVTDDGWGIAEQLCTRLEARGLSTVRIGFEVGIRDVSIQSEQGRTVHRGDPAKPEHIESITTSLSTMNVVGMIHLAPMKLASASWSEDTLPSSQISLAAHGWFGLLKGMDAQLAGLSQGLVASVTSMDGRHGNIGERFNSIQCASSGVTKSYAFERPNLRTRALDVHPELIFDAASAAEHIETELFERAGEVEIGLDRDGRRWLLAAFAEDVVGELDPLKSDDVWLVSGGGSGVTAACIVGVAEASQGAEASFHLLGRSVLIEQTADWLDWSEEDLMKEKMSLRERLTEASSTGKVTMVEWNNAWQKFTRSRDVYQTLSKIEATGNRAFYHSIDVTDAEALSSLGASLSNPITGIVHGAGLEDSKLVADKVWETFDKVVRVKIDGWRALMKAVEASNGDLRFASAFTSVAGRFGNGGQTDYAAANSILDAEMARLTAKGDCRAVAIGWTGWRDVGMATRGSIEAVFEAAGIETLPVDVGVQIFVDEALRGGKRRVIACGSLGLMDRFDAFREAPLMLPGEMAAIMADPSRFPFIDKVLAFEEQQMVMTQSTLSVADHPFLSDHAIDGVPYHPGVMAMEMFAENALLLCPDSCLAGFEAVKFGLPVKVMKGTMRVRVEAKVERTDGDLTWIKCRLISDLSNSEGVVFGEREHHEALVRLVKKSDDLSGFLQSEITELPSIGTPPPGRLEHHASFIYLRYFHGPRFQSHGGVLRGVGDASQPGVDGIALMRHQLPATDQFAHERNGEDVLLEALPMLIEAGFQNAGLVAMESEGFSSLPVGIEWSTMLRVPEQDEELRLRSIRMAVEDGGVTVHNVLVVGSDDAPVLALKGLRLKAMAPVPEDQKFTLER
ncbi:MAG: beta-ketoacyl synthase N-terminal-like domain-containing protein [Candidatus Poseidoniaceae archaeon]